VSSIFKKECINEVSVWPPLGAVLGLVLAGLCLSAQAGIEPTSGRYVDTVTDLSVKVLGGQITWQREWRDGRWQFNRRWADLEIEYNASDGTIRRIKRNNDVYEPVGSDSERFKFGPNMRIRTTADGLRWYDRQGNWIDYDEDGRVMGYGDRNDVSVTFTRDPEGRLAQVFDHHGDVALTLAYQNGKLHTVTDRSGRFVSYAWQDGRLDTVTDVRGYDWRYSYNGDGQLSGRTDPLERTTTMTYRPDGRIQTIERPGAGTTTYEFDYLNGQRQFFLKTTEPGGRTTSAWYDREGELVRRQVNGQLVKRVEKDGRDRVHFDFNGHATTYHYDEFDNLTGMTFPDGTQTVTEYEHSHSRIIREIDEAGVVTRHEYDGNGNRTRTIEAEGTAVERITEFEYDALGRLEVIRRLGDEDTQTAETAFTYDTYGNLAQITGPENGEESRTHDVMGNVLTRTDPLERTWTYTYDDAGNLTSETNPESETTTTIYDEVGNRVRIIHPDLTETEQVYDDADRLKKVIDALDGEQTYTYDSAGNRTRETDPSGKQTHYAYDADRRLEKITDGAGNEIVFHYPEEPGAGQGARHQPIKIEYPTFERLMTYDRRARVVAQTDRWLEDGQWREQTTRTTYDERGNQIAKEDPAERTTEFAYDPLGRMTTTTDALEHTTTYHYDNRDNLIGLTDANNNTHVFTFDRADRMMTEARPMGETTVYEYDDAGQLFARTDPVGNRAEYEYDDAGRRTEVRHYAAGNLATPERTVTFSYDERGRMTGYDDGTLSGSYTYDDLGRKTEETVNYPGFSKTHGQSWHANGRQASLTAPDGTKYAFGWDEADRMESVTVPGEGVIAYTDYDWRQPSRVEYPGGTVRTSTYDGLQRHETIQVTNDSDRTLMDYDYSWDEAGNITEKATEHGTYTYGYDDSDRLIAADYPTLSSEEWTYDPIGNRLTDTATGETEWQYNDNNELLDSVEQRHEYDDSGSLVAEYNPDGRLGRTFEYNAESRMSAVRDGNGDLIAEYLYDPFGRRVSKTVYEPGEGSPETTWYVYKDQGLMAELDELGNAIDFYLFPPDGLWSTDPILRKSESSFYYYQTDHLGTPQQLMDKAGKIVHTREMAAFGRIDQQGLRDSWRFPGQYSSGPIDRGYYNKNRYYFPRLGIYNRVDPAKYIDGPNVYKYAKNNPLVYIDPLGLYSMTDGFDTDGAYPELCIGLQCICRVFPRLCDQPEKCVVCNEPEFSQCVNLAIWGTEAVLCGALRKKSKCLEFLASAFNVPLCVAQHCYLSARGCRKEPCSDG
jgi:RHS repeat-associated protein